jgi:hypothetical protein
MPFIKTDPLYQKGLNYTKIGQIINNFETKAIINATYLNPINSKWDNQYNNFLIGIYIFNDSDDEKTNFINNPNYILSLNNKISTKIKLLQKTDELYEHIPLFNPHAKYYLVSYKKDGNINLNLVYTNKFFGATTLKFMAQ